MRELIFLFVLLVFSVLPLTSNEVLIYQVVITHQNEVEIYNYTFIINSVQNNFVNFTLIITNENNGTVILNQTYVYPVDNLKLLPVNGNVFNGINFTFSGYSKFNNQNASVYTGYFVFNNLRVPSTAYFVNNTLVYLNGSTNGYSISVSLNSKYNLISSSSYGGYIILGVIIAFIAIGVILLIKIGKI